MTSERLRQKIRAANYEQAIQAIAFRLGLMHTYPQWIIPDGPDYRDDLERGIGEHVTEGLQSVVIREDIAPIVRDWLAGDETAHTRYSDIVALGCWLWGKSRVLRYAWMMHMRWPTDQRTTRSDR